uniref:DUF659 domain-containing protein n=1 Tax=Schizaphis graminum TaxID=13262 RepID=A0A2S2PL20_SCHGA
MLRRYNERNSKSSDGKEDLSETTVAIERYIANKVIGTLEVDKPGKIFLLLCKVVEKANHSIVSKLFDKALFSLWPSGIQHDDVLFFVADAAPFMVKAANAIKTFYSKMIHITSLAHGLHPRVQLKALKSEDLLSYDLIYFMYTPISSTDVERKFSRFKNIFLKINVNFCLKMYPSL